MTGKSKGGRIASRDLRGFAGVPVIALAAMMTMPAIAQDQQNQDKQQQSAAGTLPEVMVTARYRSENIQTTPIAISAFTADQLKVRAITNTNNLGDVVPNLYTRPGDAEEGPTPTISMRGVTAGDYSFESYPAVGIYVDDVYHSTMVGSSIDLLDIDRIEVKRGPQGTLAGNASIAGSISIYSKKPTGDDTGHAAVTYGSRNLVNVNASFDTALIPNELFMRVSGVMKRQDGYVDRLDFTCEMNALGTPALAGTFPAADNSAFQRGCKIGTNGGTNLGAAKVMLRWVPNDKMEISATGSYSKEDDEAPAEVLVDAHPSSTDGFDSVYSARLFAAYGVTYDSRFYPPAGRPYSAYTTFCRPLEGICFDNSQGQFSKDGSLSVDYDINDDVHLKVIGAYSNYGGHLHQAGDVSPLGYVQGQVFFGIQQGTGEIRLTGTALDGKLDWVTGGFFLKSKDHLSGAIDFVIENFTEDDFYHNTGESGYGHVEYHVTDRLSVSGGLRYSAGSNSANLNHQGLLSGIIPFSVHMGHVDWLAAATYNVTDDMTGYVTVATGSRPKGITTIVNSIYQLQEIPEEELTSYEVGLKTEFFNHRLRTNITGFYSDYSKRRTAQIEYQCLADSPPYTPVPVASDCPPGGVLPWYITVARPATIKGIEFELTAEPIDGLLAEFSGGYNHFVDGVKTPGLPGYIVPGNLPQPEWNLHGGIQYAMSFLSGTLTPRLDWAYQTKSTYNPASALTAPSAQYTVPGRSTFNGRLTFKPEDSKWSFVFAVTNLTNKYYLYELFTGSTVATAGVVAPPREFSFELRRDF